MLGRRLRGEREEVGTKTWRRGQLLPFLRLKRRRGPFRPCPPSAQGRQSHRPPVPTQRRGIRKKPNFYFLPLSSAPGSGSASALLLSPPFTAVSVLG